MNLKNILVLDKYYFTLIFITFVTLEKNGGMNFNLAPENYNACNMGYH